MLRAPSTRTWAAGSSGPRSCPMPTWWSWAPPRTLASTDGSARRARRIASRTETSSRSCSVAEPAAFFRRALVRPADALLEVGQDRHVAVVHLIAIGFGVGQRAVAALQFGQEIVVVESRYVDGCGKAIVGHHDESVLAPQDVGDGLDERILLERVLDAAADRLDCLEKKLRIHLLLARQQQVGEEVVVALVKLVEIHRCSGSLGVPRRSRAPFEYTAGSSRRL